MKWNKPFTRKEAIIILSISFIGYLALCVWAIIGNLPLHSACCGLCGGLILAEISNIYHEMKDEKLKENIY